MYTTLAFLALLGAPYTYDISSLRVKSLPPETVSLLLREWQMFSHVQTNWELKKQIQYHSSQKWTQRENCACLSVSSINLYGSCICETICKVRNTNVLYTKHTHTHGNSPRNLFCIFRQYGYLLHLLKKTTTYYLFYKCTIFGSINIHIFCKASAKIYTPTPQQWSSHTNWKPTD